MELVCNDRDFAFGRMVQGELGELALTPLPGTAILLGSAMLGMAVWGRRFKRKK